MTRALGDVVIGLTALVLTGIVGVVLYAVLQSPGPALGGTLTVGSFAAAVFGAGLARAKWPRTTIAASSVLPVLLVGAVAVEWVMAPAGMLPTTPTPRERAIDMAGFARTFPGVVSAWMSVHEDVIQIVLEDESSRLEAVCIGTAVCSYGNTLELGGGWRVRVTDNFRLTDPVYECGIHP